MSLAAYHSAAARRSCLVVELSAQKFSEQRVIPIPARRARSLFEEGVSARKHRQRAPGLRAGKDLDQPRQQYLGHTRAEQQAAHGRRLRVEYFGEEVFGDRPFRSAYLARGTVRVPSPGKGHRGKQQPRCPPACSLVERVDDVTGEIDAAAKQQFARLRRGEGEIGHAYLEDRLRQVVPVQRK